MRIIASLSGAEGHGAVVRRVLGSAGLCATVSTFGRLYWAGRAFYDGHRLQQRIVLTQGAKRVAHFDAARFPINDVAFHPTQPVLAIATGTYDGG